MNQPWETVHPASGCESCPALAASRHTVVWSRGPQQAEVMVISEGPGYREDQKGQPMIGISGQLLTRPLSSTEPGLLAVAGFDPREVHIANRTMCMPPGDRDPTLEELDNCEPWLIEHIRLVAPKLIILMGVFAVEWRFGPGSIAKHQGVMYRNECDGCGQLQGEHLDRYALKGAWTDDIIGRCQNEQLIQHRLYAATYNPAAVLRDPDKIFDVVRTMSAAKEILDDA